MTTGDSYILNKATGAYSLAPGAGTAPLGNENPSPATGNADPYTIFNTNMAAILANMAAQQPAAANKLGAVKNSLQTMAVAPNGPAPANPAVFSQDQVAGQQATMGAFAPGIADISTQLQNANAGYQGLASTIAGLETAYAPVAVSPGQSLMTKTGQVLARAPAYLPPSIRQDNGQLDSFDQANGVWKSDTVSAGGNGPGSHGYGVASGGADQNPVSSSNNNPFGIKATAYSSKLMMDNGISTTTGSAATDGGNFLQFDSPVQATKAARVLLQSPIYAKDTINQALQAWSNNGYDGKILTGTGIDPNSYVKDLSGVQTDTLLTAMLKAEQGPGSGTVTTKPTMADPKGNVYNSAYAARVAQMPENAQKFILAGPSGSAFVDGDTAKVAGFDSMFANLAPKAGLNILSSGGIEAMNNMNNLVQNIQSMKQLVAENLGSGATTDTGGLGSFFGHVANSFASGFNNLAQNKPALTEMNTYIGGITSAAAQLKLLAGGQGSGLRITGFEIGATQDTLPNSTDSWQTAQAKISALDMKASQWMHTNFPDIPADQPVTPASQTATAGNIGGGSTSGTTPGGVSYTIH